ncbi:MAG TPA: phosphopantetheine-binding protein [Burkholderiales bacterium]
MNSKTIQFEPEQAGRAKPDSPAPFIAAEPQRAFITQLLRSFPMNTLQDDQKPTVSSTADLQREVADLMIKCLNLEVSADQITPDAPLYGEGLGLDSIDVLEVALEVSKRYGLQLRSDSKDNQHIFSSLRSLSDYIAAQRTR